MFVRLKQSSVVLQPVKHVCANDYMKLKSVVIADASYAFLF